MKRPEDRLKPGRKNLYQKPRPVSLVMPEALLERAEAADVPGKSRNAKLLALIEAALDQMEEKPQSAVA